MTVSDWADLELVRSSPEAREALGITNARPSNAEISKALFDEGMRIAKERFELGVYEQMAHDQQEQRAQFAQRQRLMRRGRDQVGD